MSKNRQGRSEKAEEMDMGGDKERAMSKKNKNSGEKVEEMDMGGDK